MTIKLLLLSLSVLFSSCCCVAKHNDYMGPRDEKCLKDLVMKRFDFNSIDGYGEITSQTKDEEDSCHFNLLLDRKQQKLKIDLMAGLPKSTFFEFTTNPLESMLARRKYFDKKSLGYQRIKSSQYHSRGLSLFLGGVSVQEFRQLFIESWPPRGKWKEDETSYRWGEWVFDKKTLVLLEASFDSFQWTFEYDPHANDFEGVWKPTLWKISSGEDLLRLDFIKDDVEMNPVIDDEYFEIDIEEIDEVKN